jgi:hypothetical protein
MQDKKEPLVIIRKYHVPYSLLIRPRSRKDPRMNTVIGLCKKKQKRRNYPAKINRIIINTMVLKTGKKIAFYI